MSQDEDDAIYVLNYDKIAGDPALPAIVRMAAQQAMNDEYISVSEWLRLINDDDLAFVVRLADCETTGDDPLPLIALAMILATAEGGNIVSDEAGHMATARLCSLVIFESLARKGIVDFDRNKATLSGEFDHIVIAIRRAPDEEDGNV